MTGRGHFGSYEKGAIQRMLGMEPWVEPDGSWTELHVIGTRILALDRSYLTARMKAEEGAIEVRT